MLFQQEFYLLWSSLELFMAMTHLFVFLGVRNSKLGFLRRQQNYFLLDGLTHLTNALLHPPQTVGRLMHSMWLFAFAVHIYYYIKLVTYPPPRRPQDNKAEDNAHQIPSVFHWSCVEYSRNRFNPLQSGKEMLETTIDVVNHSTGFLLAFRMLGSFWYQLGAILLMLAFFYRQMLSLKYFLTEPKMMPPQLQRLFAAWSTNSVAN